MHLRCRSKISPAGVYGFAGMNPSPIPAKEKVLLCDLCDLERTQRVDVRKKALKAFVEIRTIFCYYVRMEVGRWRQN